MEHLSTTYEKAKSKKVRYEKKRKERKQKKKTDHLGIIERKFFLTPEKKKEGKQKTKPDHERDY